ncbi:MAG TPA: acetylxylan esterase [Pirellulaceae bacterium]|jgi:dienelactone hydrolase|nr:acetylxylan esterase [Pirellulaceae bacterium]
MTLLDRFRPCLVVRLVALAGCLFGVGVAVAQEERSGAEASQRWFEKQVFEVVQPREAAFFDEVQSWNHWQSLREEEHAALWRDLGLEGLELGGPLEKQVTGTVEHDGVVVEKLHFQSLPGLYVTANLYLPKKREGKLPAILYLCGHGRVEKNGVSYGNKVHYQHHGIGFAMHGFACLVVDTVQLGEIGGLHHGTHNLKLWDWVDRGYTPAGMEAWNAMRAIDLLVADERIDGNRIGVTGRSGGGAYSWWTAALDERVKVAAPVAGITDLQDHVVDNCVAGHCDCMYFVNRRGVDYSRVAALVAPRPLLLVNTDRDPIFPLQGVVRTIVPVFHVYQLAGKRPEVGVAFGPGAHQDTPDIQLPVLRWMLAHLQPSYAGEVSVDAFGEKPFEPEQLKVFEQIPKDEIVTKIHEIRLPARELPQKLTPGEWNERAAELSDWVRESAEPEPATVSELPARSGDAREWLRFAENRNPSGAGVGFGWTAAMQAPREKTPAPTVVFVESGAGETGQTIADGQGADEKSADGSGAEAKSEEGNKPSREALPASWDLPTDQKGALELAEDGNSFIYFLPSGTGPTAIGGDEKTRTHWLRKFYLLGKTLPMLRAEDLVQGLDPLLQLAAEESGSGDLPAKVYAREEAVLPVLVWATRDETLEAELHLDLRNWRHDQTTWIGIARTMDPRELILLAAERHDVHLIADDEDRAALEALADSVGRRSFRLSFEAANAEEGETK